MKYLLSRGLIYNIADKNILTIWINGKLIELSKNESIIWNAFSWCPKNIDKILHKNINCLDYVTDSMVKKGVLSIHESDDENICKFFTLAKNKVKLLNITLSDKIKSGNIKQMIRDVKTFYDLTSYDKMVYNYLKDYNGEMSISDIVLAIDGKLFTANILTDGYSPEYIKQASRSESSLKVLESVIKLLDAKLIYVS